MYQQSKFNNQFFLSTTESSINPHQLFLLDFWSTRNLIWQEHKGRGTVYFLDARDLDINANLVLRHYYHGGLYGKFNTDKFLFTGLQNTRSFQELRLLAYLKQCKVLVARPIAARVVKHACFYTADIITEYIDNSQTLAEILQLYSLPHEIWISIGKTIRKLHNSSVNHTDLNIHNILLQNYQIQATDFSDLNIWLIDFDKCFIKHSNNQWQQQNLSRLKRSLLKEKDRLAINFNAQNWQSLIIGYNKNDIN